MTMSDRIVRKKSKRAFTLVELVIVIAILAVLAAVAIPIITSSINSARISTMESNSATVEMLIKEAINTYEANISMDYNGKSVTNATVKDVLIQNGVDTSVMDVKQINGMEYSISWSTVQQGTVLISGTHITPYNIDNKISSLE